MNVENRAIRTTQVLFYLLVIELVLLTVKSNDKPLIPLNVLTIAIIVTFLAIVGSVFYYLRIRK